MKFISLVFFSLVFAAENPEVRTIDLTVGIGLVVEVESAGAIRLDKPLVNFTRLIFDGKVKKLLLLPRQPGLTELVVMKEGTNVPQARYTLQVHPREDVASIKRQMNDEASAGLPVEWMELHKGEGREIALGSLDGPIFLSDPRILSFLRLEDPDRPRLMVNPLAAGITDLTVYKADGNEPLRRFYFEVRAP